MTTRMNQPNMTGRIVSPRRPIVMTITLDPGTGQANMAISESIPILTALDVLYNLWAGYWKQYIGSIGTGMPTAIPTENPTEKPTDPNPGASRSDGGANGQA